MKLHQIVVGMSLGIVLLAGCANKENQQQDNHANDTNSHKQSQEKQEKNKTSNQNHTNNESSKEATKTNSKTEETKKENKSGSRQDNEQNTKENSETASTENNGKTMPDQLAPGPQAKAERQLVAEMLLDQKLSKDYITAADLEKGTYTTKDQQQQAIPYFVLFSSLEVPRIENGPSGMTSYFSTHVKDTNTRTLIGISDNEVVIGMIPIKEGAVDVAGETIDYQTLIHQPGTQVFKASELNQLNLDSKKVDALAQRIYQTTPHTLQFVPKG